MRFHSDFMTESDVRDALNKATARGNVDRLTVFMILEPKGSRTRKNGFEVRLEWIGDKVKGDGRHWTNSGKFGANSYNNGNGTYAATYDEWGWFIAELFDKDENAVFGSYKGMDDFNGQTKYKFELTFLALP